MPRKAKGIHSSPEHYGVQNMPENYTERKNDELCTMQKVLPVIKKGQQYLSDYKGLWTEETLKKAVNEFFEYCAENDVKPDKSGLQLWLGLSTSQYYDWAAKPDKYGSKTEILDMAHAAMRMSYANRLEQYPTGNIFLLKAAHGMNEVTKVEISNPNNVSKDDIADAVSKLGLDAE